MKKDILSHKLPHLLYNSGAVKIDIEKGFKLKLHDDHPEEPLSPIYLDLRMATNPKPGPLTPAIMNEIGKALWQHAAAQGLEFDAVCGLPNAGTPIAEAFHEEGFDHGMMLPIVTLGKTTGAGTRKIEGVLKTDGAVRGDNVLVVDDLITAGDSKLEGIEALQNYGFRVSDVLVLVDREQGGSADLLKRGIRLHYLFTLRELVNLLFKARKVRAAKRNTVLAYLEARVV